MILTLAALLASPAPGCRTVGPSVHCILAAPLAAAPPSSRPNPRPPLAAASAHRPPLRIAQARSHPAATHMPSPPDADEIARHIASLVTISDCTGARAYVAATGDMALAEQMYAACIGRPSPAGLPSGPMPADTGVQTERRAAPAVSERPS